MLSPRHTRTPVQHPKAEIEPLTERQVAYLIFLQAYRDRTMGSPSHLEAALAVGYKTHVGSVKLATRLVELGALRHRATGGIRSLQLTVHYDRAIRALRERLRNTPGTPGGQSQKSA